jgi:hypothetical protein
MVVKEMNFGIFENFSCSSLTTHCCLWCLISLCYLQIDIYQYQYEKGKYVYG